MRLEATRCKQCGTRPVDWIDSDGRYHVPPQLEVELTKDPGCVEVGRIVLAHQRSIRSLDQDQQAEANAGLRVRIIPFDPTRVVYQPPDSDAQPAIPMPDAPTLGTPFEGQVLYGPKGEVLAR